MTDNRTTEQTVTESLRALLTERGIKFKAWDGVHPITVWHDERFSYEYTERSLLDGAKPHTGEVLDGTGFLKAVIHVCTPEQAIAATMGSDKPPYDELLRCLENDWHISASWDGLRKFWCVELTEEGVRMRDAHDEALRCSDCKYYGNSGYDDGYCYYWNTCDFGNCIHDPDDFCSRGEPKTVCQIPDSDLVLRPFCRSVRGHCSECGVIMCDASNYCQNCGRKVMG